MKRLIIIVVSLVVLLTLAGGGTGLILGAQTTDTDVQPTVTVWPPVVELNAKTSLVILGSGFEPGQELYILLRAAGGTTSNLVDWVKPTPDPGNGVAVDEWGNFASVLTLSRLERLQSEGVYSFIFTDMNFKTLTTAPVGFADPDGKSRAGLYSRGAPDYEKNPDDMRPLPWCEPFFEYPERP